MISSDERMTFWESDGEGGQKWKSNPEQHAKNLLISFLRGRCGVAADIFDEIRAGAGKVDVCLVPRDGAKILVELKMCGSPSYSKGYAKEGLKQLTHYMKNRNTTRGYLLVFDSRTKDQGVGFEPSKTIDGMSIVTIIVDVRPKVK